MVHQDVVRPRFCTLRGGKRHRIANLVSCRPDNERETRRCLPGCIMRIWATFPHRCWCLRSPRRAFCRAASEQPAPHLLESERPAASSRSPSPRVRRRRSSPGPRQHDRRDHDHRRRHSSSRRRDEQPAADRRRSRRQSPSRSPSRSRSRGLSRSRSRERRRSRQRGRSARHRSRPGRDTPAAGGPDSSRRQHSSRSGSPAGGRPAADGRHSPAARPARSLHEASSPLSGAGRRKQRSPVRRPVPGDRGPSKRQRSVSRLSSRDERRELQPPLQQREQSLAGPSAPAQQPAEPSASNTSVLGPAPAAATPAPAEGPGGPAQNAAQRPAVQAGKPAAETASVPPAAPAPAAPSPAPASTDPAAAAAAAAAAAPAPAAHSALAPEVASSAPAVLRDMTCPEGESALSTTGVCLLGPTPVACFRCCLPGRPAYGAIRMTAGECMAAPPPVADALTDDLDAQYLADMADAIQGGGLPEEPCDEVSGRQVHPDSRVPSQHSGYPCHHAPSHRHQPCGSMMTHVQFVADQRGVFGPAAGVAAVSYTWRPAGRSRAAAAVAGPARPRGLALCGLAVWQ